MSYEETEWDLSELGPMIDRIDRSVAQIRAAGMTDAALVLLIQHAAPTVKGRRLAQADIQRVLGGLDNLRSFVLRDE